MPQDKPNTAVAEVRCDRRILAALGVYYKTQSNAPKSTSELLRAIIYDYYQLLLDHELLEEITSTALAVEVMNELNFVGLNRMGRGSSTLSKQISKEAITAVNKASEVFSKLQELDNGQPEN